MLESGRSGASHRGTGQNVLGIPGVSFENVVGQPVAQELQQFSLGRVAQGIVFYFRQFGKEMRMVAAMLLGIRIREQSHQCFFKRKVYAGQSSQSYNAETDARPALIPGDGLVNSREAA